MIIWLKVGVCRSAPCFAWISLLMIGAAACTHASRRPGTSVLENELE